MYQSPRAPPGDSIPILINPIETCWGTSDEIKWWQRCGYQLRSCLKCQLNIELDCNDDCCLLLFYMDSMGHAERRGEREEERGTERWRCLTPNHLERILKESWNEVCLASIGTFHGSKSKSVPWIKDNLPKNLKKLAQFRLSDGLNLNWLKSNHL